MVSKRIAVLMLVCCLQHLYGVKADESMESMHDAFRVIDKFLNEQVRSDDIEANMAKVSELLEAEGASPTHRVLVERACRNLQFLKEIFSSENKCAERSYFVLASLNRFTEGAVEKEHPVSRVEKIARHYATRHAEECAKDYEVRMNQALKEIDSKTMERVDAYLGVDIKPTNEEKYLMDEVTTGGKIDFEVSPNAAQQAYDALIKLTKGHEGDASILHASANEGKLFKLYEEYFEHPCNELSDKLFGIALPAIFDKIIVSHGDLPEIYKKFFQCAARRTYDYSHLIGDMMEIVKKS